TRGVNEIQVSSSNKALETRIDELTSLVKQLTLAKAQTNEPSFEDLVKQMAAQNIQFQQTTEAAIKDLKAEVGQLATTMNQMQARGSSTLPIQTIPNPNVSAITLRSGKEIDAAVGI
ncbi:hypothetical protein A2U01_0062975, partial [Trifolium medium]|nr:hypothetical protein [Trifolium medium]